MLSLSSGAGHVDVDPVSGSGGQAQIAAAVGWVGLTLVTGGLAYVAPLALTVHLFGDNRVGVVVYLLAPVVVAVFVRRPWWVRWIVVGVAVVDLTYVALAYLP